MTHFHPDPAVKPWDLIQSWDSELMGGEILDDDARERWTLAFAIAGGLPYIWQQLARPISDVIYGLLELRAGDRVLLIGEALEPSGWLGDIERLVGPGGGVEACEIIHEGRAAVFGGKVGRNGMRGCWEWTYSQGHPDAAFDCVAVLQAAQHCDDWPATAHDLMRVTKPDRRIVLAEAVNAGPTFHSRIDADVHIRQWYEKLFATVRPEDIPYYSGEELAAAFGEALRETRIIEWHGIEMMWGRTPPAV